MKNFPEEFNPSVYRNLHIDLKNFKDKELKAHFESHGKNEGRVSNSISSRNDFVALLSDNLSVLEIGPFCKPVVKGKNVKYFDVLNKEELIERSKIFNLNPDSIPFIDFVDPFGDLDTVNEKFDAVISSHCIEHQPDVVVHLQKVEKLLNPGGVYFLLIPDKRYIFDHFIPETTIADVIAKHEQRVTAHSLKSVIEHRAMTTHNYPHLHWEGNHGVPFENFGQRAQAAIKEFNDANGAYIDVHASYFTPDSFNLIINTIREMGLIQMSVVRNYHTRRPQNEFCVIMQKPQ